MPLSLRLQALLAALGVGAVAVGCSYEHGPLADKPDTTSLGTATRWPDSMISTSHGIAWRPEDPNAVIPGTVQGETSALTTQVQPPVTLLGTREDWSFGQSVEPRSGWVLIGWTSGPNLPVEAWNMALESAGEGAGEGPGAQKSRH